MRWLRAIARRNRDWALGVHPKSATACGEAVFKPFRGALMLPVPASSAMEPRRWMAPAPWQGRFLLLFAMLQLADVVTTNHGLAAAEAVEANPVMALAMTHLGTMWWLPKVAIVAFAMIAVRRIRKRWPFHLVAGILVALVANNLLYW